MNREIAPFLGRWRDVAAQGQDALHLTERQEQVLTLLSVGLTTERIAAALGISPRTARAHIDVLKSKLAVARAREIPLAFRLRTGLDPVILTGLLELVRGVVG
jgi:DNA-binding NarL/FixJ family response regulator